MELNQVLGVAASAKSALAEMSQEITNHKNIYISETEPSIGDGENGDVWFVVEPIYEKYYTEGVEDVDWVVGYSIGNGAQSKEAGYLHLELSDNATGSGNRTYVTDTLIDLSLIKTLKFELEITDASDDFGARYGVSESKTSGNNSSYYVVYDTKSGDRARSIYSLDVTAITGSYYIRIAVMDTSTSEDRSGKVNVYKVWGEG